MAAPLAETMRAAYVERLGPVEEIVVGELGVPVPGPTDVLVAAELVAANPVDTLVRSGRYPTSVPFPFVVGRDVVGTVVAAGPGTPFDVGERVWSNSLGHDGRQGSFSEYAVVPAERCYRLPGGVDAGLAAAVAHPAATAYLAWFVHGDLRPGRWVYVGGGGGNVGSAAIAMARRAGARVLASAQPRDHDRCRKAGANVIFDYRDPDLAGHLRSAAPGGVDVFWETSAWIHRVAGYQHLTMSGEAATTLHAPGGVAVARSWARGTRASCDWRDVSAIGESVCGCAGRGMGVR